MIGKGYSMLYDAIFYLDTKEWTEKKCSDKECDFCRNRPDTAEGLDDDFIIKQLQADEREPI